MVDPWHRGVKLDLQILLKYFEPSMVMLTYMKICAQNLTIKHQGSIVLCRDFQNVLRNLDKDCLKEYLV
jgi:hypothetical protein